MTQKLSAAEIDARLTELAGWHCERDKLFREFRFIDFPSAFGFMAAAAIHAEAMNHHPEWFNAYSTVKVWLTSHDVGGVSERDFALARIMGGLFREG